MINIIYHYFPRFRQDIFQSIADLQPETTFIYGRNARFGISSIAEEVHHVRRNFYIKNLIFQSFCLGTLRHVAGRDSVILGDLKFLNSWIYALIGRMFGRRVLFWTHGVLARESGLKWRIRIAYYNLAHGLLLYSEHEAELMQKMGFKKPIFVVGNANFSSVDLERARKRSAESSAGLCYVGRISAEKKLYDFVRFAQEHPDRKVLLIGPLLTELDDRAQFPENLSILAPEYDLERLRNLTADCDSMVMFTPAGLSLFTAALLGKRIIIRRLFPQKPEYHLLQAYDLIEMFEDYEELKNSIEQPALDDNEYHQARVKFLENNTAEVVASRLLNAHAKIRASAT